MNRGRVKRSSVPLQRGPPSIFIFLSVYTLPRPGDTLAVPTQHLRHLRNVSALSPLQQPAPQISFDCFATFKSPSILVIARISISISVLMTPCQRRSLIKHGTASASYDSLSTPFLDKARISISILRLPDKISIEHPKSPATSISAVEHHKFTQPTSKTSRKYTHVPAALQSPAMSSSRSRATLQPFTVEPIRNPSSHTRTTHIR